MHNHLCVLQRQSSSGLEFLRAGDGQTTWCWPGFGKQGCCWDNVPHQVLGAKVRTFQWACFSIASWFSCQVRFHSSSGSLSQCSYLLAAGLVGELTARVLWLRDAGQTDSEKRPVGYQAGRWQCAVCDGQLPRAWHGARAQESMRTAASLLVIPASCF